MLVDTAWLAAHLDDPTVVVVDMRWREDGSGPRRYREGHIPGAVAIDWSTDLVEPDAPVAFTLAGPERFRAVMERDGIGDDTLAVAYADEHGSGPFRLWVGARRYGHSNVRALDGGLARWIDEGRALSTDDPPVRPASWTPRPGEPLLATGEDVAAAEHDPRVIVLDSRPPEQFRGEAVWFESGAVPADPDGIARTPRGELRAGRVPWALNVPVASVYRDDGTLRSEGQLRSLFAEVGVRADSRVITYCGVGISASGLVFALRRAGVEDVAVYESSWEEWGRDPTRPIARDTA